MQDKWWFIALIFMGKFYMFYICVLEGAELLYEEPRGDLGLIKTLPWIFFKLYLWHLCLCCEALTEKGRGIEKRTSTQTQVF